MSDFDSALQLFSQAITRNGAVKELLKSDTSDSRIEEKKARFHEVWSTGARLKRRIEEILIAPTNAQHMRLQDAILGSIEIFKMSDCVRIDETVDQ